MEFMNDAVQDIEPEYALSKVVPDRPFAKLAYA
jgi:hypothetical protein